MRAGRVRARTRVYGCHSGSTGVCACVPLQQSEVGCGGRRRGGGYGVGGDGYGSGIRIHSIGRGRISGPRRGQDDGEKAAQVAEHDRATREG